MPNSHALGDSRTKTVATLGPASSSLESLKQLITAGVDVFRINMAHGDRDSHEAAVQTVRQAASEMATAIGILVDLAGPKIRLGELTQNPLTIENGDVIRFVRGTVAAADDELTCLYEPLIDEVEAGELIVLADGLARLEVTDKQPNQLVCQVIDGGPIRSRQGVNLPGTQLSVPALGAVDRDNAVWAAHLDVDFISLSFVRNAAEVEQLKSLLAEHQSSAQVVAKIEKREALNNLQEIVRATDVVMVARGDLGVEIPIEKTPAEQKRIIRICHQHRKPVIVATQMLESMHSSKQPTRAEVTDVANAILDGADACMLSGETAIGIYPVESVRMMNRIMTETEQSFAQGSPQVSAHASRDVWDVGDAIVYGSAHIAKRIGARMVVVACHESMPALLKSKQRDFIPTVCVTDNPTTLRRMALYWGVIPVLGPPSLDESALHRFIQDWIQKHTELAAGDSFVMVTDHAMFPGRHDSIMVSQVEN